MTALTAFDEALMFRDGDVSFEDAESGIARHRLFHNENPEDIANRAGVDEPPTPAQKEADDLSNARQASGFEYSVNQTGAADVKLSGDTTNGDAFSKHFNSLLHIPLRPSGSSGVWDAPTPSSEDDAIGNKSPVDGGTTYAELFGDGPYARTLLVHGFDALSVDGKHVVIAQMVSRLNNREVLNTVIKTVPVDVMDMLIGTKFSTDSVLHDPSVLANRLTISREEPILEPVRFFINTLSSQLKDRLAGWLAEKSNLTDAERAVLCNRGATSGACESLGCHKEKIVVFGQLLEIDSNPSEAQKQAGNFLKASFQWNGLHITVETAKGYPRSKKDKDGKVLWIVDSMPAHYGYITGPEHIGKDGDHVDCYVGPDESAQKVWVIWQVRIPLRTLDEHKCMLGFASKKDAVNCYILGFTDGKGNERIGEVREMTVDEFKAWLPKAKDENLANRKTGENISNAPGDNDGGLGEDLLPAYRRDLILRTTSQITQGYIHWREGQNQEDLDLWPYAELYRAEMRIEPRDWPAKWASEGGQFIEGESDYPSGRMIARKDDSIWYRLGPFGNPFPPFDFNSGMGLKDISLEESTELGLMKEGDPSPEPVEWTLGESIKTPVDLDDNTRAQVKEMLGKDWQFFDGKLVFVGNDPPTRFGNRAKPEPKLIQPDFTEITDAIAKIPKLIADGIKAVPAPKSSIPKVTVKAPDAPRPKSFAIERDKHGRMIRIVPEY